ncbi:MAG: Gluconolactonase [Thermoleophilia bacterium]|nr:Gluconolactonase [Thermoleophilia bacterium]
MLAKQVTGPVAHLALGPVWSEALGGLQWLDLLAGDVLSLRPDGSVARRNVSAGSAAALRPRTRGGAVLAVERGFALEAVDGTVTQLPELWDSAHGLRMSHGTCDPDGRFWAGSTAVDGSAGAGALWRLDADLQAEQVLGGLTSSNGLEWGPDGTLAYLADTASERIDVFDYDPALGLVERRPFVALPDLRPSGLTVDEGGGVWVAMDGSSAVHRYDASGSLDMVVEIPSHKATCCTFGGPNRDILYITTSSEGMASADQSLAGALFSAEVGCIGVPTRAFAG